MPAPHSEATTCTCGVRPHGTPPSKARRPPARLAAYATLGALLLASAAGCYQDPEQILQQQQLITDMSDAVNEIGLRMADLQATVDSLGAVVARQDTVIYRLANLAGVAYQLR